MTAAQKRWATEHAVELRAKAAAAYAANREERKAKMREDYRAKKAEYIERAKRWAEANPEKARKAKRKNATSERGRELRREQSARRNQWAREAAGTCTLEQRRARIAMFGGLCWVPGCGREYEMMDHVIPLARGGANWPANLRPICRHHNCAKGARDWREFASREET